jgi:hypothetical protein
MKFLNVIIVTSAIWLLVSFWNRNDLPRNIEPLPVLENDPKQTSTSKRNFSAVYKDVEYAIEPVYDYDLYGMVVSFRHHDGESHMHARSNDHLNMLDVCVVWGDNAGNPLIHNIDFWNGIFTCIIKTKDMDAWDSFDMYQISNNHLISDNDHIRDKVKKISIGDQIRVRGFLASYGDVNGGKRGTSTTRTDTGDGACETLYVEHFQIVQSATSSWRISMYASLAVLLAALFFHFKRPYRPY